MEGFISIHRKIFDNWVWEEKPFSRGQAWIDILLLANHKDNKFPLGKEIVTVPRGSFITSELKLMERWGWGKTKTRTFLKLLEDDNMIVKKSNSKQTTITVCNYNTYQLSPNYKETTNEPQINHRQTTDKLQTYTNNNDNNVNNDNNENNKPTNRVVGELATHYSNCFRKMIPPLHSDKLISYVEEGMDLELVKYIMEYSSDKKDPWKYCCKVLENSSRNLINTLADFKANLIAEGDNYGKYSINTQQGYRGTTKETEYRESVGDVQKYYNGDLSKLKDDEEYDF